MKSACCSTSPLRKEIKLHLYQSVKSFPMLGKWRHRLNISRSDDLHISMSKKNFFEQSETPVCISTIQHFSISTDQQTYVKVSRDLGRTSNTTLRILSIRGVPPPPFTDKIFSKKKVTDSGGTR